MSARSAAAVLLVYVSLSWAPATAVESCDGCTGGAGSIASSGGLCAGIVELTLLTEKGRCDWLWQDTSARVECQQRSGCLPVITRTWRELPHEVEVDHCAEVNGRELCLWPRPDSGQGWGRTIRNGPRIPCDEAGDPISFKVGNAECDMETKALVRCSACRGRI